MDGKEGKMEKGGSGSAIVKSIVLVALGALIVLGVYLVLTRSRKTATEFSKSASRSTTAASSKPPTEQWWKRYSV